MSCLQSARHDVIMMFRRAFNPGPGLLTIMITDEHCADKTCATSVGNNVQSAAQLNKRVLSLYNLLNNIVLLDSILPLSSQ